MTELKRKGSRTINDIPKHILDGLNSGKIESVNLVEWLAIDQELLLENILKKYSRIKYLKPILSEIANLEKKSVNTLNAAIGKGFLNQSQLNNDPEILAMIATDKSDSVRCWAAYAVGRNKLLDIKEILKQIQPFAADQHFGVREISWLATRASIAKNLAESLEILSKWATHSDQNIRRFASEATRPRGVWCEHIEVLKHIPQLALPILEPLKSDQSKYVQNSVGNWLNDASKTEPKFVIELCKEWKDSSNTRETAYIIKKALRTVEKLASYG